MLLKWLFGATIDALCGSTGETLSWREGANKSVEARLLPKSLSTLHSCTDFRRIRRGKDLGSCNAGIGSRVLSLLRPASFYCAVSGYRGAFVRTVLSIQILAMEAFSITA